MYTTEARANGVRFPARTFPLKGGIQIKNMAKDNKMNEGNHKWHGAKKLLLGLLILANVYYIKWDWATFIGSLLVLFGLWKMMMPGYGCCHDHH